MRTRIKRKHWRAIDSPSVAFDLINFNIRAPSFNHNETCCTVTRATCPSIIILFITFCDYYRQRKREFGINVLFVARDILIDVSNMAR